MRTMQSGGLGETSGLRARLVLSLIASAGIAATAASCSLIVDTNADVCTADSECTVAGTVCSKVADKPSICAPAACSATTACKAGSVCTNSVCLPSLACTTATDCKDAALTCDAGKCVAISDKCDAAACEAKGAGFVCRADKCVGLLSKECTTVYGDYKNVDAVFFGSVLPTTGGDASTGRPIENALKLALDEFNLTASGLPALPGSTKRRPMVLVGCSDDSDNATAVIAAKHLAEDVGVVAIVGGAFSGITIDIANTVTIPDGVLLISPSATSVAITDLDDHDLVWRTSPPDSFQAQALSLYLPEIEAQVRADLGLMPSEKIKVAILNKGDAYGSGLAKALEKKLVINGKPATDQSNNGSYIRVDYGNPDDPTVNPTKYPQTVAQTLAFKPHVTLVFGANEGVTDIFAKIEEQWNGAPMVSYRSQFIFADAGEIPELWQYVAGHDAGDTLRPRIRGTVPGTDNDLFKTFRSGYLSKFQDGTSPDVFGVAGGYDIVYLLGYSAAGLGATPLTGANLAQRMKKMSTGAKVDVGAETINGTFLKVTNDGSIDYNGASGPLNFDLKTGEAPSDIQIWCIPKDQGTGKAGSALNSGRSYSAADDKLIGTLGAFCK
jgi:branched-chain amino acid transport system substrate-binding protein